LYYFVGMFNFRRQCCRRNASINSFWNTIFIYFSICHVTLSERRIFYSMLVWQLKLCENKLLFLLPNFLFFFSIYTWKRPAIPFLKFSSVNELAEETYRFSICPFFQCAKNGWSENLLSILDLRSINWRLTSFLDFLDHVWSLGDLNYKTNIIKLGTQWCWPSLKPELTYNIVHNIIIF